ncbi:LacI family DNA-binding transcriptional regulator [Uliginosibacterium sp. sgz301328]|uniref:LacI family DNA-binding transcriptional regulator n=1 Tax=Uliginosibacterium sp. sgz301328 TaxID=3243764 RepID=UPI00359CE8A2
MARAPRTPTKTATIRDVARVAKTSTTTVSYVLSNEKRYIRPELRERVIQAAEQVGYVKNAAASSIKGKQKKVLAVVVAQFGNTFFTRMCVEIVSIARQAGYVVMLCNSDEDPEQEKEIIQRLIAQRIDGCIVSPALSQIDNLALLQKQHIPYVVLERSVPGAITDHNFVSHDNVQSAYLATRHLLDAGHRHIAFVAWDSPIPNVRERVEGYRAALREFGVVPREDYILNGPLAESAGVEIAERLSTLPVTAIVFAQHDLAKGALRYFQNNGIRWPDDYSFVVVGTPEWAEVIVPHVTCIQRPEQQMARAAASLLLHAIQDPDRPTEQHVFPSTLVESQSVRSIETAHHE